MECQRGEATNVKLAIAVLILDAANAEVGVSLQMRRTDIASTIVPIQPPLWVAIVVGKSRVERTSI
jgi:hypothetical protein